MIKNLKNKKFKNKKIKKIYFRVLNSFQKNLKTWCFLILSIYFITSNTKFSKGLITMFIILFLAYYIHYSSHKFRNWFTISHHYHHENNNIYSHFIQIVLESLFGLGFPILNNIFLNNILDNWIILFIYIFYTTVHNINYSILHINKTHEVHHKEINTNFGPDICDLLFDTKNNKLKGKEFIEDTEHYIPNIVISMILILVIKKFNSKINFNKYYYYIFFILSFITTISNTYLFFYYDDEKIR